MGTYHGSCHCGAIKFEVEADLSTVTRCTCSVCTKKGILLARVHPNKLQITEGEDRLKLYQFNTSTARHYFCNTCGIYPFHRPRIEPDAYTINVNCLADVDDNQIMNLDIVSVDGRSFSTSD